MFNQATAISTNSLPISIRKLFFLSSLRRFIFKNNDPQEWPPLTKINETFDLPILIKLIFILQNKTVQTQEIFRIKNRKLPILVTPQISLDRRQQRWRWFWRLLPLHFWSHTSKQVMKTFLLIVFIYALDLVFYSLPILVMSYHKQKHV